MKTQLSDTKSSDNSINGGHNERLKPPVNDTKILKKRIRLSSTDQSEVHMDNSHDIKRKCQVGVGINIFLFKSTIYILIRALEL